MASVAASPVGLHCLDVTHEVLGQADAKDLWDRGQVKERRLAGWWDGGWGTGGGIWDLGSTWRRAMPTKTPATMTRLSCSHFSNWPTQPLVWMEPCCSSSWWAREGYTQALGSAHLPPQASSQSCHQAHLAPGPHASAPAAWSSAAGLPIDGSFISPGSQHRCSSSEKPPLTAQPLSHPLFYFIFFQALS